jgi:hypothetical protein
MKYIRLFENYDKENPTEEEVYSDADEYFLSLNPDLLKTTGYNTYAHHVKSRKEVDYESTYAINLKQFGDKTSDETFGGLQEFFAKKGYNFKMYSPILNGEAKRVADLVTRINMSRSTNSGGELGRALWIKCRNGKYICFYFSPIDDPNWWPICLSIHRFDDKRTNSIYWTSLREYESFKLVFWNKTEVIDGNFSIVYDYDEDNECSAVCDSASDSFGYTATVNIPDGEADPEDVKYIRRK